MATRTRTEAALDPSTRLQLLEVATTDTHASAGMVLRDGRTIVSSTPTTLTLDDASTVARASVQVDMTAAATGTALRTALTARLGAGIAFDLPARLITAPGRTIGYGTPDDGELSRAELAAVALLATDV